MRFRAAIALALLAGLWWLVARPSRGAAALGALAGQEAGGPAAEPVGASGPAGPDGASERPVVVLSPGHGWWAAGAEQIDPGDTGAGLTEKDVALDVAQQAQALLARCGVAATLTRTGDDAEHTLASVHELVNAQQPRLAVAVHTAGSDAPSGVMTWHTVGGWDDAGSQRLAERLRTTVAARLGLPAYGPLPETASNGGGLYIHPWQAPAALVELGSLGADAEALRNRSREFARAITQAVLDELGLPATCADGTQLSGWPVAVTFPGEAVSANLALVNDGLLPWDPAAMLLTSVGEAYGAAAAYPLPAVVQPGESATWAIPARAPQAAGVHEQRWQLTTLGADGQPRPVGEVVRVIIVVVPPQAEALKDKLDQQIAEWKAAGEAKADELIQHLKDEIKAWAVAEAERQAAKCIGMNGLLLGAVVMIAAGKRKL
jgi:N-acetylmuramoyl-L-alanine amidase